MMAHAGYGLMEEKRAAIAAGVDFTGEFSSQGFLEVVLGAAIALWGGIDEFKPIRVADSKRVRWETQHAREASAREPFALAAQQLRSAHASRIWRHLALRLQR